MGVAGYGGGGIWGLRSVGVAVCGQDTGTGGAAAQGA